VKITDHVKQDVSDGVMLAAQFIDYFYRNELALVELDKGLKRARLKIELTLALRNSVSPASGPFWEDLNYRSSRLLSKLPNFPKMPNYELSRTIRPYMLLNFISVAEKFIRTTFPCAEEQLPHEMGKVRKWLFCEVILHLHSWGSQEMLGFIQQRVGGVQGQEAQLEAEFEEFMRLGKRGFVPVEGMQSEGRTDVYPSKSIVRTVKQGLSGPEDSVYFPIFSCDGKFLKALLCIAENQVRAMETVVLETIDALRVDFSQYGIPSLSDPRNSSEPVYRRTTRPEAGTAMSSRADTVKPLQRIAEAATGLEEREEELQDSVFRSTMELAEPLQRASALTLSKPTQSYTESEDFPEENSPLASGERLESGEYTFRSNTEKETPSIPPIQTIAPDYASVSSDYKQEIVTAYQSRRSFLAKRRLFDVWKRHFLNSEVHYSLFKAKQHNSSAFSSYMHKLFQAWQAAAHRAAIDRFILAKTFHRQRTLSKVVKYWAFEGTRGAHVEVSRAAVMCTQRYAESRLALKALYSWRLHQARMKKKRREVRGRSLTVKKSWMRKVLTLWLHTVRPSRKYTKKASGKQALVQDIAEVLGDIREKEKGLMELWGDTREKRVRTKSCRTCSKEQSRSLSKDIADLRQQMRQLKGKKTKTAKT